MSKERIYCGNAKTIQTPYGDLTKVSMHKDDINAIVKWMKDNNSDWVNFAIKEKQTKVDGKPTHYCEIDEWKPEQTQQNAPTNDAPPPGEDSPF